MIMAVDGAGYQRDVDMKVFWVKRLHSGDVPEPEHVYVPIKEMYLTGSVSTSQMYKPENYWRELFGRHRCIACGKPFWSQEAAFDCHPEASAYIVWEKFKSSGVCCTPSAEDSFRLASAAIYRDSFTSGPFI